MKSKTLIRATMTAAMATALTATGISALKKATLLSRLFQISKSRNNRAS